MTAGCWTTPPAAAPPGTPPWLLVLPLPGTWEHVLVLVGDADLSTADQLLDQLLAALDARPPALRVELASLDSCDLHGLDAMHRAAARAEAAGVRLRFSGLSQQLEWLQGVPSAGGAAAPGGAPAATAAGVPGTRRALTSVPALSPGAYSGVAETGAGGR